MTLRRLFLRTNLAILRLAGISELAQCDTDNLWFPDLKAGPSYPPPDCCEVVPMTTPLGGCGDRLQT